MLRQFSRSHVHNMLLSQGVLNLLGGFILGALWAYQEDFFVYLSSASAMFMGAFTCYFALKRQTISSRLSSSLFAVNLIPAYYGAWIDEKLTASQGSFWVPFQGYELCALALAILAPPARFIGVFGILIFLVMAWLQFLSFSPAQLDLLPQRPMAAPLAFTAFALVLYFFRLQGLKISELIAHREAEVRMMTKFTQTILAIKDFANSPLQSLTIDAELLRRQHPSTSAITERMQRSLSKLQELNQVLDKQYDSGIRATDPVVLDSLSELELARKAQSP